MTHWLFGDDAELAMGDSSLREFKCSVTSSHTSSKNHIHKCPPHLRQSPSPKSLQRSELACHRRHSPTTRFEEEQNETRRKRTFLFFFLNRQRAQSSTSLQCCHWRGAADHWGGRVYHITLFDPVLPDVEL